MIRLLLLLLLSSCAEDFMTAESISWVDNLVVFRTLNIDNLETEEDESINELYLQVELSEKNNINDIDSVLISLEYVGSSSLEYNENFKLYDDGTHGDIIENNGVYTLVDLAEKVQVPEDDLQITSIDFPDYIEVQPTEYISVGYSVLVKGKKYLATVYIFTKTELLTYSEYINLDNTKIAIEKNNAGLYMDLDDSDEECTWELSPDPPPSDYFEPLKDMGGNPIVLPDAKQSGDDYFVYEDSFQVWPLTLCQATGTLIWRFKLISKENENSEIYKDKTFILYGCGDGICTEYYESKSLCPEDCANE